jgi:hypothetical protein
MSMSLPCFSFPYDWTNHSLLVISSR